jgi:ring-1,2-phenylacetyl-CoA epoxidase subunit PaaC
MAAASDIEDFGALDDDDREALRTFLLALADDELVVAERYTEWQVRAPTLESDIALANIAQDELGHARLWYQLVQQFGEDETDLIWERDPADFRHSTLTELPFEEGDWADAVVRSYLYDVAEDVRLHAMAESSVAPIRDRVGKVLDEEDYHLDHARSWLGHLVADGDGAREQVQEAVDRLFPHALTIFEPAGDVEDDIDDLGIRTESLAEMRDEWLSRVESELEDVGVAVPEVDLPEQYDVHFSPDALPVHVGRDGDHTDHWAPLHEEMTETYRELGRDSATRIMES